MRRCCRGFFTLLLPFPLPFYPALRRCRRLCVDASAYRRCRRGVLVPHPGLSVSLPLFPSSTPPPLLAPPLVDPFLAPFVVAPLLAPPPFSPALLAPPCVCSSRSIIRCADAVAESVNACTTFSIFASYCCFICPSSSSYRSLARCISRHLLFRVSALWWAALRNRILTNLEHLRSELRV